MGIGQLILWAWICTELNHIFFTCSVLPPPKVRNISHPHFQEEMHSGKSICSYRQKKPVRFSDLCAKFCFDHGWLLSPSIFCLPMVGSFQSEYLQPHSSYNLRRRAGRGVKSPSSSGNRRLYWKSMPFPCIYHCHSCSAYFWYSPCIVSSDCHVIKSLLITRAYFYAEISIRSLLQRPPDQ